MGKLGTSISINSPCIWIIVLLASFATACPGLEDYERLWRLQKNGSHDRRWYTVQPGSGKTVTPSAWPDSTLPFCYQDDNSRNQLSSLVTDAWNIWKDS